MRARRVRVAGVLLAPLCACLALSAQGGALVVSADDVWFDGNGRVLERRATVPLNTRLTARGQGDLLLQCPNSRTLRYTCRSGTCTIEACGQPPPGSSAIVAASVPGLPSQIWEWLFTREPKQVRNAIARSGGSPADAVLRIDGAQVHWGPTLARVLEGEYCLDLSPLPAGSGSSRVVTVKWDRAVDANGAAPAAGVGPGLYVVVRGQSGPTGACQRDEQATSAWVLIAPAADYDSALAEWNRDTASVRDLQSDGASALTIETIRHSVLAAIAQRLGV